jgi:hypothetical protein
VCDPINPVVNPIPVLYSHAIRATILFRRNSVFKGLKCKRNLTSQILRPGVNLIVHSGVACLVLSGQARKEANKKIGIHN